MADFAGPVITWVYRGSLLLIVAWAIDEYRSRGEKLDDLAEGVANLSAMYMQQEDYIFDYHISIDERLRYLERRDTYQADHQVR